MRAVNAGIFAVGMLLFVGFMVQDLRFARSCVRERDPLVAVLSVLCVAADAIGVIVCVVTLAAVVLP